MRHLINAGEVNEKVADGCIYSVYSMQVSFYAIYIIRLFV